MTGQKTARHGVTANVTGRHREPAKHDPNERNMNNRIRRILAPLLALAILASGCAQHRSCWDHYAFDPKYYRDVATEIEEPNLNEACLQHPPAPQAPITLETFESHEPWSLSLFEAVQTTLANSKVVRQISQPPGTRGLAASIAGAPNVLLRQSPGVQTIFDPAIQESGTGGVESALSAFDAQLSTSMFWERRERPLNRGGIGNVFFSADQIQDLGTFRGELSKRGATGARYYLQNNVHYLFDNSPTRGAPSDYQLNYQTGVEMPLLQGSGVDFNRIAGPDAQPGIYNGVLIARINQDISLADFEGGVRDLVYNVENAYWELYVAYRVLDSARFARDAQFRDWQDFKEQQRIRGGGLAVEEAQARSALFRFQGALEAAVCDIVRAENRLRYLMGIPATDGCLIRPSDEPATVRIRFDWDQIHQEAIVRNIELRKQRWRIEQKDLELIASRNFLMPRLDATAVYKWLGAGDDLIDPNGRGIQNGEFRGTDAFATLTDGSYQEWQLGLEFSMPLGFRRELSAVRNAQLQLARERARLHDQELEVSHLVSDSVRNVDCNYDLLKTDYNNLRAADDELEAFRGLERRGARAALYSDVVQALSRRAEAEARFYRSLVNYNRSIIDVHYHKGSLLEYDNVYLAEGPWPFCAYADAARLAADRTRGCTLNYCMSPRPSSVGPVPQPLGLEEVVGDELVDELIKAPPADAGNLLSPP